MESVTSRRDSCPFNEVPGNHDHINLLCVVYVREQMWADFRISRGSQLRSWWDAMP